MQEEIRDIGACILMGNWRNDMIFIKPEELKKGMRLARPVYNGRGVLLYDINTKLTRQGLEGIRNFGLMGVYVLEPAEPAPILTEDDIEFERFQAINVLKLSEELKAMVEHKGIKNIQKMAEDIIRRYGRENRKINFLKSMRSPLDYTYKHCLNVAILSAIIAANMGMSYMEQVNIVTSALIHDVGKVMIPEKILKRTTSLTEEDEYTINKCEIEGNELIQNDYDIPSIIRIIISQSIKERSGKTEKRAKLLDGTKVFMLAEMFDTLTAMNINGEPFSEIAALRLLMNERVGDEKKFDERAIGALMKGINILTPGVCIELSNGIKGLVIKENPDNILRPVILSFHENKIYDLMSDPKFKDMQILDVMKTMDERVEFELDEIVLNV